MAEFHVDGQRLAYTVYGEGPRTTILLPGLLLSQKMQAPLARRLAARGNRVVTFDPLGHGASSRPRDQWRYSIAAFAQQTVELMDHLELERAVVGGTSLGANISLELALQAPSVWSAWSSRCRCSTTPSPRAPPPSRRCSSP
jgi:pimeloyl-ACP methyl ester carboxylesterase